MILDVTTRIADLAHFGGKAARMPPRPTLSSQVFLLTHPKLFSVMPSAQFNPGAFGQIIDKIQYRRCRKHRPCFQVLRIVSFVNYTGDNKWRRSRERYETHRKAMLHSVAHDSLWKSPEGKSTQVAVSNVTRSTATPLLQRAGLDMVRLQPELTLSCEKESAAALGPELEEILKQSSTISVVCLQESQRMCRNRLNQLTFWERKCG